MFSNFFQSKQIAENVPALIRSGLTESLQKHPEAPIYKVVTTRAKKSMTLEQRVAASNVETVSYAEEVPRIYQWANFLFSRLAMGVNPAPRIVILGKQCPSTIRAMYAVFLAGAVPVLIFPEKSGESISEECSRSKASFAVVENDAFKSLMTCESLTYDELEEELAGLEIPSDKPPAVDPLPTDTSLLLFTSGTSGTGKAQGKLVVRDQLSVTQNISYFDDAPFAREQVMSGIFYIAHVYPLLAHLAAVKYGMTCVLPGWKRKSNRVNPMSNVMALLLGECHHIVLIPMYFPRLLAAIDESIDELCVTEPLKGALVKLAIEAGEVEEKMYFREAYQSYGEDVPDELGTFSEDAEHLIPQFEALIDQVEFLKKLPHSLITKILAGTPTGVIALARLTAPIRSQIARKVYGPNLIAFSSGGSQIDWESCVRVGGGLNIPLNNGWGSTEAGILTFHHATPHWLARLIGKPIRLPRTVGTFHGKETEIYQDPDNGVLYVAGPTLFTEYEGNPEKTQASFVIRNGKRYFNTGDVVKLLGKGDKRLLQIVGRAGREYKTSNSGGEWVVPDMFEAELCKHQLVDYAIVWGHPDYNDSCAVVSIEPFGFEKWATEQGFDTATQRKEALAAAEEEILAFGREVVQPAVGKTTRVILKGVVAAAGEEAFDQNEDFLTTTRKPRFNGVVAAFKDRLLTILAG